MAASKPPAILYHGTSPSAAKNIMSEGLRPMNRQYVHLSTDKNQQYK
jgi:putative RNA 2'-phosphotransferase